MFITHSGGWISMGDTLSYVAPSNRSPSSCRATGRLERSPRRSCSSGRQQASMVYISLVRDENCGPGLVIWDWVKELSIPQTTTQRLQSQSSTASTGQNLRSSHTNPLPRCFVKVEGEFIEDTNHHVCVVQLPATFDVSSDTTHSAASIPVRGWRPLQASFETKWVAWFNESGHNKKGHPWFELRFTPATWKCMAGQIPGRARSWLKLDNSWRGNSKRVFKKMKSKPTLFSSTTSWSCFYF